MKRYKGMPVNKFIVYEYSMPGRAYKGGKAFAYAEEKTKDYIAHKFGFSLELFKLEEGLLTVRVPENSKYFDEDRIMENLKDIVEEFRKNLEKGRDFASWEIFSKESEN